MPYYAVDTKCGHVGKNNYVPVRFPVEAENGKDAAAKARKYKRVKHHHKDAILQVQPITFDEFKRLQDINNNDPYLHCKNIQEQRTFADLENRIEVDESNRSKRDIPSSTKNVRFVQKKNAIRKKDAMRQIREYSYCDYENTKFNARFTTQNPVICGE